jgi:hypothetical protein
MKRKAAHVRVENFSSKTIRQFVPGDTIYATRKLKDFTFTFFGNFVKFAKGCVTLNGHLVEPDWADARSFGAADYQGQVTVTVRLKRCYLWGKSSKEDRWPVCHWFKDPDKPAS